MKITLTYNDIKRLVLEAVDELTAMHNTSSDFDRFDTNYVNSGLGTQSYGWGMYFSTDKNVTKGYREEMIGKTNSSMHPYQNSMDYVDVIGKENPLLAVGDGTFRRKKGAFEYVVELPEDNGHNYINWDGPMIDGLDQKFGMPEYQWRSFGSQYDGIAMRIDGGAKRVSLELDKMGYDGIKVAPFRNRSGNREMDNCNYIIFNDKKITIIDKIAHIPTVVPKGQFRYFTKGKNTKGFNVFPIAVEDKEHPGFTPKVAMLDRHGDEIIGGLQLYICVNTDNFKGYVVIREGDYKANILDGKTGELLFKNWVTDIHRAHMDDLKNLLIVYNNKNRCNVFNVDTRSFMLKSWYQEIDHCFIFDGGSAFIVGINGKWGLSVNGRRPRGRLYDELYKDTDDAHGRPLFIGKIGNKTEMFDWNGRINFTTINYN